MIRYYSRDKDDFMHLYKYNDETNEFFYMDHCWTGEGVWYKREYPIDFKSLVEISEKRAYIIEHGLDENNHYHLNR